MLFSIPDQIGLLFKAANAVIAKDVNTTAQREDKLIQSRPTALTALQVLTGMFTRTRFALTPVPALRNSNISILSSRRALILRLKASWDCVRTTLS